MGNWSGYLPAPAERRHGLVIGSMDNGMGQIATGIGDYIEFAALDLLARIIAPYSAAFRGLDALAVDHTGAG